MLQILYRCLLEGKDSRPHCHSVQQVELLVRGSSPRQKCTELGVRLGMMAETMQKSMRPGLSRYMYHAVLRWVHPVLLYSRHRSIIERSLPCPRSICEQRNRRKGRLKEDSLCTWKPLKLMKVAKGYIAKNPSNVRNMSSLELSRGTCSLTRNTSCWTPELEGQGEPMRRSLVESRNHHRFSRKACVVPRTLTFLTDLKLWLLLHRLLQLKCVGIPIKPFPHTLANT